MSASAKDMRAVRLIEFNLHPARFAHRSWYLDRWNGHGLGEAIFGADGRIDGRAEPGLSSWLLQELGLQDEMDWEMDEPRKRLWMLDGPSLERLALELALAMHRDWLVRVIDGARLRALAAHVGGKAVRFVVEEVPEGAFHYEAPAVSFDEEGQGDLAKRLKEQGARTLMALLDPAWRAVRGRAQLYFDRAQALSDPAPPVFTPEHNRRALELICGRLIPRRFPEWAWCF